MVSTMKKKIMPYHESIVQAIDSINNTDGLNALGDLILITKTPKNHNAIISAWKNKSKNLNLNERNEIESALSLQKESEEK